MSPYKKILKEFLVFLPVLLIAVGFQNLDFAHAAVFKVPEGLCGIFPCPEGGDSVSMAKNLAGRLVANVRFIIGALAVVMIVVSAVKLVMAQGNEEVLTKQTTTILYAIIGLFVVGLAGEISAIFDVNRGGFLKDPNVTLQRSRLFSKTVETIITFIKYIIGSVAVLYIVRSALRLVMQGDKDEEMAKDKKSILWGLLGLVFILMANPIINKVFFKIDTSKFPGTEPVQPGIDTKQLAMEIAGATNLIAAIAGPMALISLVIGGIMYITAGGEDEKMGKAKKIMLWSSIGIVVIYGAFAIVSTFVTRQFEGL